jgi:hypothetical protein
VRVYGGALFLRLRANELTFQGFYGIHSVWVRPVQVLKDKVYVTIYQTSLVMFPYTYTTIQEIHDPNSNLLANELNMLGLNNHIPYSPATHTCIRHNFGQVMPGRQSQRTTIEDYMKFDLHAMNILDPQLTGVAPIGKKKW